MIVIGKRVRLKKPTGWWMDEKVLFNLPVGATGTLIEFHFSEYEQRTMVGIRFDEYSHPKGWECGMLAKLGEPLPEWLEEILE